MDTKQASKKMREIIKALGIKATYTTKSSMSFDFILHIHGNEEDREKLKKAIKDNKLIYSDPKNNPMIDYFGSNNSMVFFNGTSL